MNKKQLSFALGALLVFSGCTASTGNSAATSRPESSTASSAASSQTAALTVIQLVPEADGALVNDETGIAIQTTPKAIILAKGDFTTTGGSLDVQNDKAIFKADKAGSYTISAVKDGVKSNSVTIRVVTSDDPDASSITEARQKAKDSAASAASDSAAKDASAGSAANSSTADASSSADAAAINVRDVLKNPEQYLNKVITVAGALPQEAVQDASGNPEIKLYPDAGSTDESLTLTGKNDFNFGGCDADVTGTLKKDSDGKYVLDVDHATQTSSGAAGDQSAATDQNAAASSQTAAQNSTAQAGNQSTGTDQNAAQSGSTADANASSGTGTGSVASDNSGLAGVVPSASASTATGTPVSSLPASGTFHFTANDLLIRTGMNGLESPSTGYVYNDGMSVNYDGVYTKDGYTWLTYVSYDGVRRSVPIGNDTTVLYGYLA